MGSMSTEDLSRSETCQVTAPEARASDRARTDAVAEWLEQGEYLDPDTLDWPDHNDSDRHQH